VVSNDAADAEVAKGPLHGLVVADFSRVLAGPYCTMLLADLGATVIKVEHPRGDETRAWRPPVREGTSTYYLSINRNKRSVVLDLEDLADRELGKRLASRADVLVENFKPYGLCRFGLDYESVAATNPGIVYASITGFGTAGGAKLPGYDLLVQALSGLMSITGAPDTPPFRSGVAVFDVITGLHACSGILAALYHRGSAGVGQHLELDLMTSALSGMVNQTGGFLLSGMMPSRIGNDHPSIFPYAPFDTADGQIVLAVGNDTQFRALCELLSVPGLVEDPRFASNGDRSAHREELRPLLTARLRERSAVEWFEIMRSAGIPAAPVADVAGGIAFAKELGLDPVIEMGVGANKLPGIRHPIRFSRTPPAYPLMPPTLDQDGEAVRRWLEGQTGFGV